MALLLVLRLVVVRSALLLLVVVHRRRADPSYRARHGRALLIFSPFSLATLSSLTTASFLLFSSLALLEVACVAGVHASLCSSFLLRRAGRVGARAELIGLYLC